MSGTNIPTSEQVANEKTIVAAAVTDPPPPAVSTMPDTEERKPSQIPTNTDTTMINLANHIKGLATLRNMAIETTNQHMARIPCTCGEPATPPPNNTTATATPPAVAEGTLIWKGRDILLHKMVPGPHRKFHAMKTKVGRLFD